MAGSIIELPVVDVSAQSTVRIRTGDTLVFHVSLWSFERNASVLGLPVHPAEVNFALLSAAGTAGGEFATALESEDGTFSADFGNLNFGAGDFQGSAYTGEVATLQGYLHLGAPLSESMFSGPSVAIVIRNLGSDVTMGLEPYLLRQSMFVALSSGGLSVGGIPGEVDLEKSLSLSRLTGFGAPQGLFPAPEVPEPGSGGLLLAGGVLLCGLARMLARVSGE